jgi:hypothetical protein
MLPSQQTTGYSPSGTRSTTAPAAWPFGTLTDLQIRRLEAQQRELRRLDEQQRAVRAEQARRAILARAPDALL